MNARTIKKTQTYLVELETTLREKHVKVQSQQMELAKV